MNRLLAFLAAALPFASHAQEAPSMTAVLAQREEMIAAFEAMPQAPLQRLFLRCARESSERLFDVGEAVPCAMAWDALLKRGFDGNVDGLLAWWRAHRDQPPDDPAPLPNPDVPGGAMIGTLVGERE